MKENNYTILNIREYLENAENGLGENDLIEILSDFSCPINPDIERFLKNQAIEFAKKHQAVTYLVLSNRDASLLGYFSITFSASYKNIQQIEYLLDFIMPAFKIKKAGLLGRAVLHGHSVHWLCPSILNHIFLYLLVFPCIFLPL